MGSVQKKGLLGYTENTHLVVSLNQGPVPSALPAMVARNLFIYSNTHSFEWVLLLEWKENVLLVRDKQLHTSSPYLLAIFTRYTDV